ncbi:DUF3656 domain-containing U32 family peptidase [Haloimpatiens lingqiaonensis]|uniref:DUF3656 domain-containing U32 family peptidase n=1 Tax=Haloimpatiens lingqiaonensis TaxID=1380675 RepID=UPI0010FE5665|nr:U32 family peptidase [Haloimpatiens lingqiaonensis]
MNAERKIEILAPAGSLESLYAAVQAGTDAVYLGGNKFSARAYASNFDEETMINAINYCHAYGVKVYITVNTLIKEKEIKELTEYIGFLYNIGVDALIVQDMGVIKIIKDKFPDFEVHSSTQTTVHNGEGAKLMSSLGVKRVVLAREMSLKEIEYISKDLNIETEVFVHGALCICYSGQCLMSSMIGGRSGNRGRCAQPCRLPYNIINKVTGEEKKGYLLSPKDICSLEFLKELVQSGTSSLKIEGRMKRPEYVAGVVSIYRNALDSIYEKGYIDGEYVNSGLNKLKQLFNREGFSKGYMFKNEGKDMMAYNFPKNTGVLLGKSDNAGFVTLQQDLKVEDGVRFRDKGFTVSKMIKNGNNVEKAYKGDVVKIFPCNYKGGDILYKTSDVELLENLSLYYKNPYNKRVYMTLKVKFKIDEKIEISTEFNGKEIKITGDVVQRALKRPLEQQRIIENLCKTKDTPFEFSPVEFSCYEEGFMPMSSINNVRRELVQEIYDNIKEANSREKLFEVVNEHKNIVGKIDAKTDKNEAEVKNLEQCVVLVSTKGQLKAALDMHVKSICIDLFIKNEKFNLGDLDQKVYLKIPNILKEGEFIKTCDYIEKNLDKILGIVTANLGIINKFRGRTSIIGDYKLNIFNSKALNFYDNLLDLCALSVELNREEIKDILKNEAIPAQYVIYGKTELMVSQYCPIGSVMGGMSSDKNCNGKCKSGSFVIKDRTGAEFPIITDDFCRSHIYNSVSSNLIPNLDSLKKIGIKHFRIDFIDENYEETCKVLKSFNEGIWQGEFNNYTRGHFRRGAE